MPADGTTGRPQKLDELAEWRDGKGITVEQKTLELVAAIWRPRRAIASAVGITTQTLDNWLRWGAKAREKLARGEKITQRERRWMGFLSGYEKAEGEAIAARIGGIQRAGQPRERRITKTTTKQVLRDGQPVTLTETTTTVEQVPGEWTALAWQLERGLDDFARRVQIEGVRDGNPIVTRDERASQLADSLRTFLDGARTQREIDDKAETNGHG